MFVAVNVYRSVKQISDLTAENTIYEVNILPAYSASISKGLSKGITALPLAPGMLATTRTLTSSPSLLFSQNCLSVIFSPTLNSHLAQISSH